MAVRHRHLGTQMPSGDVHPITHLGRCSIALNGGFGSSWHLTDPKLTPPARGRDHAVAQSGSLNHSRHVHSPKGWIWTRPGLVTALRTTRALLLCGAACSRLLGVAPERGRAHRTRALQLSGRHAPRRDLVPRPSPKLVRPSTPRGAEPLWPPASPPWGEGVLGSPMEDIAGAGRSARGNLP